MKFFLVSVGVVSLLLCGVLIGVLSISSVSETADPIRRTHLTTTPTYRSLNLSKQYTGAITEVFERKIKAPRTGTITKKFNSDVADGKAILELDSVPLIAVVSEIPFWRDLALEAEGTDVESLERFLWRLDYLDQSTIDKVYDTRTELAVERWRQANGIPDEYAPGPLTMVAIPSDIEYRLESDLDVGDHLSEFEMVGRIVATERVIIVSIPVGDITKIKVPARVEWRLPGSAVSGSGRLISIDDEITIANSGLLVQAGRVEIDDRTLSRRMPVGSPLEVRVTTATRERALTVPVGFLATDTEGQPAVLVSRGNSDPVLVTIEVGLIAEGYIEILAGVGPETPIVVPLQ